MKTSQVTLCLVLCMSLSLAATIQKTKFGSFLQSAGKSAEDAFFGDNSQDQSLAQQREGVASKVKGEADLIAEAFQKYTTETL